MHVLHHTAVQKTSEHLDKNHCNIQDLSPQGAAVVGFSAGTETPGYFTLSSYNEPAQLELCEDTAARF